MKQVTLHIPDNKYPFFIELVKNLDFVKTIDDEINPSKKEILVGLQHAIAEVKLIKAGKKKAQSLNDFLNEL